MEKYIEVSKLIEKAIKRGIDFGKGDPYNRLRYYTKIGWLPNMKRIKDDKGNVKGHYEMWVVERLIEIENLKAAGLNNDEISKKLNVKNKFSAIKTLINSEELKRGLILYTGLIILLIIVMSELGLVTIGKAKSKDIAQQNLTNYETIIDKGSAFVPKNKNSVTVKANNISANSTVHVTFTQEYTPAARYWIDEIIEGEGFTLRLDAPLANNTEFNWWITN